MHIVEVIPIKKNILNKALSYFIKDRVLLGSIIEIDFRGKKIMGLVVSIDNLLDNKIHIKKQDFSLKKASVIKNIKVIDETFINLINKYNALYKANISITLLNIIPINFIKLSESIDYKKYIINRKCEISEKKEYSKTLALQGKEEERHTRYIEIIKEKIKNKEKEEKNVFVVFPTQNSAKNFYHKIKLDKSLNTLYVDDKISNFKKAINFTNIYNVFIVLPKNIILANSQTKLVILDEENSDNYRMVHKPNISMRNFVFDFCRSFDLSLIVGDIILSPTLLLESEIPKEIVKRDNFNNIIINKRDKKDKNISQKSYLRLLRDIKENKKILIYSNNKNISSIVECGDCRSVVKCLDCDGNMNLVRKEENRLFCKICGTYKDTNIKCSKCDSWNLVPKILGSESFFDYIKNISKDIKVLVLDKDSIKKYKKHDLEKELESNQIVIATQSIFSLIDHKYFDVTLVPMLDFFIQAKEIFIERRIFKILEKIQKINKNEIVIDISKEITGREFIFLGDVEKITEYELDNIKKFKLQNLI